MAQLVERRVRNAKARGSNPLVSTKHVFGRVFLLEKMGFSCFATVPTRHNPWQARADAYAITEAAVGLFSFESPCLHQTRLWTCSYKKTALNECRLN